MKNNHKNKKP